MAAHARRCRQSEIGCVSACRRRLAGSEGRTSRQRPVRDCAPVSARAKRAGSTRLDRLQQRAKLAALRFLATPSTMKFQRLSRMILAAGFASSAVALHAAEAAPKPNVILIISDDQGFTDYGFMGHKVAKTPNLDRIASQSLLYTRGYVMPVCSPSLASLLTGKLPHGTASPAMIWRRTVGEQGGGKRVVAACAPTARQLARSSRKALTDAGYLTFQTGKLWNTTYRDVGFTARHDGYRGPPRRCGLEHRAQRR